MALLATILFLLNYVRVLDPDVLMHLKTGEWIWKHRNIPRSDIFSANAAGQPWTTHEWLWELLVFWLYKAGQWKALYALRLVLVGGSVVACAAIARRAGAAMSAALAACILAAGPLASFAEIRPQLASYLLFALLTLLVVLSQRRAWFLWLAPVIFIVWANLHGAVLLGFLVFACAIADAVIRRDWPRFRRILVGALLCAAATLLNPHHIDVFTFPFKVVGHQEFRAQIYEWARPEFALPFAPFWVYTAIAVGMAVMARRNVSPFHWFMFCGFLLGSLLSRRQIPFFALASIPVVALGLQNVLGRIRVAPQQQWMPPVAACMLALLMLPLSMTAYDAAGRTLGLGLAKNRFPDAPAGRLKNLHVDAAVLNDYNDGGYLIWQLYPEWPVTMDGRVDVYGPELVKQYQQVWSGATGWDETLRRWKVHAIIGRMEVTRVMPTHNLYHELAASPDWALVYWDEISQLFLRRGTALETSGLKPYRIISPGLTWDEQRARIKTEADRTALAADIRRSVSEDPKNRRAAAMLNAVNSNLPNR